LVVCRHFLKEKKKKKYRIKFGGDKDALRIKKLG
jgi:hypothetical protein